MNSHRADASYFHVELFTPMKKIYFPSVGCEIARIKDSRFLVYAFGFSCTWGLVEELI